jgi:hypothetical protein
MCTLLRGRVSTGQVADAGNIDSLSGSFRSSRCIIYSPLQILPSNPAFRTLRVLSILRKLVALVALAFVAYLLTTAHRGRAQQLARAIAALRSSAKPTAKLPAKPILNEAARLP